ncbi:hypothetical protein ACFQU7_15025 [Pseudoroseomonas wenyumeiae]
MPVFGPEDHFAGALSITGPITRLTPKVARAATKTLRDAAAGLTRSLGGQPPLRPMPAPALRGAGRRKRSRE